MDNRFFSLIIVPDSGNDVKSGSFNFKLVICSLGILITTFFFCLFFIIGYHIKLSQEKEYKNAKTTMHKLLDNIDKSKKILNTLSEKLLTIQRNDMAYRQFAYMDVLDKKMYEAGIGGHVIVDDSIFSGLYENLQDEISQVSLDVTMLASRVNIQEESLDEINEQIQLNIEEHNYTPSILPTHSYRITEDYGTRIHPITGVRHFHGAVDLAGKIGDKILATADGVVITTERQRALGNYIKIRHKYGYETLYGHLSAILVENGQKVKKGAVIGTMGITGMTNGVHIHYGITQFGKKINPKDYF